MDLLENLMVRLFDQIKRECPDELNTLNRELKMPKQPFPRVTYDDAIKMLDDTEVKVAWGEDLPTSADKKLAELARELENPPAEAGAVARLGREYASVQKDMDEKLAEWEKLQA